MLLVWWFSVKYLTVLRSHITRKRGIASKIWAKSICCGFAAAIAIAAPQYLVVLPVVGKDSFGALHAKDIHIIGVFFPESERGFLIRYWFVAPRAGAVPGAMKAAIGGL